MGRSSIGCGPGHLPHRDMERDGDLAHLEGLIVGLGVLVQELQQVGFHLEPDGIHPLNTVAILGRVQAELPNGFVALPVSLDRRQKLVPGEFLVSKMRCLTAARLSIAVALPNANKG